MPLYFWFRFNNTAQRIFWCYGDGERAHVNLHWLQTEIHTERQPRRERENYIEKEEDRETLGTVTRSRRWWRCQNERHNKLRGSNLWLLPNCDYGHWCWSQLGMFGMCGVCLHGAHSSYTQMYIVYFIWKSTRSGVRARSFARASSYHANNDEECKNIECEYACVVWCVSSLFCLSILLWLVRMRGLTLAKQAHHHSPSVLTQSIVLFWGGETLKKSLGFDGLNWCWWIFFHDRPNILHFSIWLKFFSRKDPQISINFQITFEFCFCWCVFISGVARFELSFFFSQWLFCILSF